MWVKICGVTSLADAMACVEAGADAVGFNFWPRSRRYRSLEAIASVARSLARRIERFGVFVDPAPAEVTSAFAADVIDVAQLHGDESPAFCAALRVPFVKTVALRDPASLESFARFRCKRFLVDAACEGFGGSGMLGDLELAAAAARRARVILAGGLTPENVAQAIAVVRPWGVDVASGVERQPGEKDAERVERFVRAAKQAEGPVAREPEDKHG